MPKAPPWFDRRLSLGNLITIALVCVGMLGSYYNLKQEAALQGQAIKADRTYVASLALRLERLETERSDMRERLIRLEIGQSQQNDILRQVLEAVKTGR